MLQVLLSMPPHYQAAAMTPGEIETFLIVTGAFIATIVVAAVILGITGRKRVQQVSQVKKGGSLAVTRNPEGETKQQIFPSEQEQKEPPVRIPSLT